MASPLPGDRVPPFRHSTTVTEAAPPASAAAQPGHHAHHLPEHPHHHAHRDVSGGRLRPAVFGAMDGLVTNMSLIAGIGGSGASSHTVVLTGVAGLVAGAFSMATGEYVSVQSQNESIAAEVRIEQLELERHPEAELTELAEAYERRGVDPATALLVAQQLSADPAERLRVHAREELDVNPDELPSPWLAASSSFVFFAVGALLPLLTYFFGISTLWPALGVAAVSLFAAGAVTSRFTGRGAVFGGARQLVLGLLAAGVTYGVGHLIGASVT
jgi:VIT1/CCC1 family predicted Fe2+/Mn2+ transporter